MEIQRRGTLGRFETIDVDEETLVVAQIVAMLHSRSFDAKWRILNHLCITLLNRTWALPTPKA